MTTLPKNHPTRPPERTHSVRAGLMQLDAKIAVSDSSLGRNDKSGAFTLIPVVQANSIAQIVHGLQISTNVNPDVTLNLLSKSR